MADRLDKAIVDYRKYTNRDTRIGVTGNGSGNGEPRLNDGSGRWWVRFQQASGFTAPVALPADTNANIPPKDNIAVEVGYIRNTQTILRVYREGLIQAGVNPAITNPSDPQVLSAQPLPDLQFLCKRSADTSKPWAVVVLDGQIEINGVSHVFHQTEFDFDTAGLVPSAGERVIACVYLKTDLTLEGFASSVLLPSDPIQDSNIDECRQQAAATSMSIWGWILDGDASGLDESPEKNIDLRPKYTMPVSAAGSITVTDGVTTVTDVTSITIGSGLTLTDLTGGAVQIDATGGGGGTLPTRGRVYGETVTQPNGTAGKSYSYTSSQASGVLVFQTTPANGDSFAARVLLAAGTYTIDLVAFTSNNQGIIEFTVNGVAVTGDLASFDSYAAGSNFNVRKTGTFTVATDGNHLIKGQINGKNGSSSNYYWQFSYFDIYPSSD